MRYTVVWVPTALRQLANIWSHASDQQAVTDAADRIDHTLLIDAHNQGVPLGPFRTLSDDPLAVLFHVDPNDCMVRVIQVRRAAP